MSFIEEVYRNTLRENQINLDFWKDYLQKLKSLNFDEYVNKLTVPILVPIGSRIFFRGELKHTNEVTVSLGADYFTKCSVKQAEVLRQHRIEDAQSKVDMYKKEQEYLNTQLSFTKLNIYENQGQEIVEVYSEEEDKAWRLKHKENMRQYKQKQNKEVTEEMTDQELWERLEELELEEELENKLLELSPELCFNTERNEKPGKEKKVPRNIEKQKSNTETLINILHKEKDIVNEENCLKEISEKKVKFQEVSNPNQTSKFDLLQQVIDKQNELQNKLLEMKNREKSQSKTEADLMSKLDELEQLDELEDEMDRLDDILETEEIIETDEETNNVKLQRRVCFADEDDSETLELTFSHSNIEPNKELYNPEKGIQKPSDIYQAYSNIMMEETMSILKKNRYEADKIPNKDTVKTKSKAVTKKEIDKETIVIKDVMENIKMNQDKLLNKGRPMSLFKKKRLQNKT